MATDPTPLLAALRARSKPTPLPQVAEEVGESAFAEFERELAGETLVFRAGQPDAVTPTAYYRLVARVAAKHGGKLP